MGYPTLDKHDKHMAEDGGGSHTLVNYETEPGDYVEMWICNKCSYIETFCEHVNNTWNDDETILSCNFCGLDVT